MSKNINVTTESQTKTQGSISTNTTITTSTNTVTRGENESFSFNSKIMKDYQKRSSHMNFLNFDDLQAEMNNEYKEIKEYFIMKPIGEYNLYETLCISELSELNREHDDNVKTKLYSSIILDNKDKIVQIKNNKINLETIFKANHLYTKMEQTLHYLCDELVCISESFENEVINRICSNRTNVEQMKKMQLFITEILDVNNEPQMKNIGHKTDLKVKYVKLAHFLLHYKGFSNMVNDYGGISKNLKIHLMKIISLRNTLVVSLTEWIRFLLGDLFGFIHQLEGVEIEQSFIDRLPIEYVNQQQISKIRAEYELLLSQKSEKIVEKIVYQERRDVNFISNFL